jgi:hypothetical protein
MTSPNSPDEALDRLLDASADVIGWDDPIARARLLQAIRDEPRCADHTCSDCYPKDAPMISHRFAKIAAYAAATFIVATVAAWTAVMIFGPVFG